ncbi:MAG: hypothetical protein H0U76_03870 [Ktedonobacteraceae bacterium]|nr:hypothetical protein [Ktedonobacteraceae bacterium]
MAKLFNFLAQNYTASPLDAAKKKVKKDPDMQRVLEILDVNPQATEDQVAAVLGYRVDLNGAVIAGRHVTPTIVAARHIPYAQQLLKDAHDAQDMRVAQTQAAQPQTQTGPIVINIPGPDATHGVANLDDMEAVAIQVVAKANTGISLDNHLKRITIFLFKTFAPFAVLGLTIPESIWVFSHIYSHPDDTLLTLTGIFAVLTDFGYLYLTVLVAMNKEAMFKRQRAGMEVEPHERRAVRIQLVLWWLVAMMDTVAQIVFLYAATKDSTFFDHRLVMVLASIRILSLFTTMFIVSFAGTELMTSVDAASNEQVERANAVGKVMAALGHARLRRQESRALLQRQLELQELQRQGDLLLAEIYADARERIRQKQIQPNNQNGQHKSP